MKLRFSLLMVSLLATACAVDNETVRRIEAQQARQGELIEDQNALISEQEALLSKLIESQQQMVEMLSDVDRTLRDTHTLFEARVQAAEASEDDAKPRVIERRVLVSDGGKVVLGRIEWAWLELLQRNLKARIDTGALSSSLNATELQPFERDGKRWIRFRVPDEEHPDGGEMYETPLVRYVRIRQASASEPERRPVVRLDVRVGELSYNTEFSLTNRENMLYPVLLGRNFLRDVAVVDVARKFVMDKHVPAEEPAAETEEAVSP